MAWTVAALVVLFGALLVLLRARARRQGATPDATTSRRTDAHRDDPPERAADKTEPASVKSCPVCLSEYPPQNRFCVRDGAELIDGRSSSPFSRGMICPTCRRGYPSDAGFCPEDADELVPYGLFGAASATRCSIRLDARKICPECGVHHAAVHFFCGQDGTELVVVN